MKRLEKCCCINIIIEFFSSQGGKIISESSFLFYLFFRKRKKRKRQGSSWIIIFSHFLASCFFPEEKGFPSSFLAFVPTHSIIWRFRQVEKCFFLDLQYIQLHLCKGRKKIAKNCIVSQLVKNEKWMFWERLIFEGLFKRVIDEIGALFKVSKGQNWSFMGFKKCFGLDGGCLTYIKKRKIMRSS